MGFYHLQLANLPPTYRCAKYFPDWSIFGIRTRLNIRSIEYRRFRCRFSAEGQTKTENYVLALFYQSRKITL